MLDTDDIYGIKVIYIKGIKIMKPDFERMWINQPSSLQTYHNYHGCNVIAWLDNNKSTTQISFISGDIISMEIDTIALSKGWIQNNG